ncbi:hexose transport-related protein [Kockovaella imperatae]|uniref:Hexose transport-related protein n=1 Tax=Kockovaella imperatae TaxID=4999 RepID=A0A1Y1U9X5_9TREE|nr:hexose transport-related protein [Kockovaella imperatae]ORX34317.1 hexose transport-related protein [Kockovaella imperatae]
MQDVFDVDARRQKLAGPGGITGLLKAKRLFGICMLTALGGLNYGYEQGAYSQALVMASFNHVDSFHRITHDPSFKGWTVAVLGLGGWFGSLVNGYCCDRFSRRWSILGGALVCLLGAALTAGAMNPAMIFVGRFAIGAAVGSMSTAVPTYNSEISSAEVRGAMVGTWQLSVTLGIMISYWIGFGSNYISQTNSLAWRLPLAVQAIPALGLAVGTFFIPYSPRWLLQKGRDDEALRVLAYLRNRDPADELIRLEFLEIKADALFEQETSAARYPEYIDRPFRLQVAKMMSLLSTWPMFKRTAITCLMMFFQQMSGIDAIVYYAPTIFQSLGLGGTTVSLLASGVVGISMFLATFPSLFIMDKLGRRPLIIIGGLGMSFCLVIVGALNARFEDSYEHHRGAAWAAAVFIWVYIFNFGYSWGPVSWVVISEIMPMSARAPGTALGASTNWMVNFAVSLFVPPMLEKLRWGTYIFFLAFMLLGVAYAVWILPETRNVSLEAMDRVFKSNDATHDAETMHNIMLRLQAQSQAERADKEKESSSLQGSESEQV